MAYMSQEHKKEIAAVVKPICKKYGITASLSVQNHSSINLTIKKGKIDFASDYIWTDHYTNIPGEMGGHHQVNNYHINSFFKGTAAKFLTEVNKALHGPRYFDKSDIQSDYFNCSHYVHINIGRWDNEYILEK